jgi:hypothetical protein
MPNPGLPGVNLVSHRLFASNGARKVRQNVRQFGPTEFAGDTDRFDNAVADGVSEGSLKTSKCCFHIRTSSKILCEL